MEYFITLKTLGCYILLSTYGKIIQRELSDERLKGTEGLLAYIVCKSSIRYVTFKGVGSSLVKSLIFGESI